MVGVQLANGDTSSATIGVVGGVNLDVECRIGGISRPLSSYAAGDWTGDTLDDAYNIGGAGRNNKLVSGIMTRGGTANFTISCNSALNSAAGRRPINLRGFVIGDAESMAQSTEYIVGAAKGNWSVIERTGTNASPYMVDKRLPSAPSERIGAPGDSYIKLTSAGIDGQRGAVTFLEFSDVQPQRAMAFQIKGNGNTAISIGVLVPFADFGDAPASYGAAMHLIADVNLSSDGISANDAAASDVATKTPAQLLPPRAVYLGTTGPDSEPQSPFSTRAEGDDRSGQSAAQGTLFYGREEDAWPTGKLISVLEAGAPFTVDLACNAGTVGQATVVGWIDMDRNGVFDASEKASAGCVANRARLSWTVPQTVQSGDTFVRLRIASDASQLDQPSSIADDGEAEDHTVRIIAPKLSIAKQHNAGSTGWSVGQQGASYTLTVRNVGDVATGPALVPGMGRPIKVLDQLPPGLVPRWTGTLSTNGWSCTAAGQRVTCTTPTALAAGAVAPVIELPIEVTAAVIGAQALTNTASVGGGMDPSNGGEPYDPVGCTVAGYCASVNVVIRQPGIDVRKMSNPASTTAVKVSDQIVYTLQVVVTDAMTLSPVVLQDFLGAGLEYVGIQSNPSGFVASGSLLSRTFTLPTGKAPGTYTISYIAKVVAGARTEVSNVVVPSGGMNPSDPNASQPTCMSACSTRHPLLKPQVSVLKSSDPAPGTRVGEGDTITYALTTTIADAALLSDVVLTDTLGAGLTYGLVLANNGYTVTAGSPLTFMLPRGTAPGVYTVRYTVRVDADPGVASFTNVVTAAGGGDPGGAPPSCVSCATAHPLTEPEVVARKSTTAQSARLGDEIGYEVVIEVTGASTTQAVALADTFDARLSYVANSFTSAQGVQLNTGVTPMQLTLPAGTVPGTYRASYRALVGAGAGVGDLQNAIAFVPGANGGDNTPTCTSCTTATPLVISVVKYSKTIVPAVTGAVRAGDLLTYQLTLTVTGASTPAAVVLTDTLASGLAFDGAPDLSTWVPAGSAPVSNGSVLTIQTPAVVAAGSYTLRYQVRVTNAASGFVRNLLTGRYEPNVPGTQPSCSDACATETPVAKPVVTIDKRAGAAMPAPIQIGNTIPYVVTLQVANAALPIAMQSMVDNVSQGLTLRDASTVVITPPGSGIVARSAGRSLVFDLPGGLPVGTYEIRYEATVTADAFAQTASGPLSAVTLEANNDVKGVPSSAVDWLCSGSCSVKITAQLPIDAVADAYGPVKGATGSPNVGNAYSNDTLDGKPVTLSDITGEVLTPATPIDGGRVPMLDPGTGVVSVPAGTPQGTYTISYKICSRQHLTLCDVAQITVTVVGGQIEAKDDAYTTTRGTGSEQTVGNAYTDNDTLDGVPFLPERVNGTVLEPATPRNGSSLVPTLDVVTGNVTVPDGTPEGAYTIRYQICEKLNPGNCAQAWIEVQVEADNAKLRIVKAAAVRTVKIGDLVRYSLVVENIGTTRVVNASILDTPAKGFTYVAGSLGQQGAGGAVAASGVRPVVFSGIALDVGQSATLVYMARVGAGVRPGAHENQALARNVAGDTISNIAKASVRLVDDPLLDESLIFGTVFDDRDRDGWQDSAAVTGLTASGGFASDAYVPGTTRLDRGAGDEAVADASAPLLQGLVLGALAARQSLADPVAQHQIVIRQKLKRLAFNDEFVLRNAQGFTVRMDADGRTRVETSGEAKAGRNAVEIEVERRTRVADGGFEVDYVVRSVGVDERGIPGVRIAAVEGLLLETDPFGRFHLVGVNGGAWERGRNFVLKLDPSTLPAGTELTTPNPLLRRITPGLPVRFDFGVALQPELITGRQDVAIDLGTVLFAPGESVVRAAYLPVVQQVADKLAQYGGGEVAVQANGESETLAFARAQAVRQTLVAALPARVAAATQVLVRTQVQSAPVVSGVTPQGVVLGTVLFETDRAEVRASYRALLAEVAAHLNQSGGGEVQIVGHTDARASHAYNQQLGLRRAQAVYEALLPYLSKQVRPRVQVEPPRGMRHADPAPARGAAQPVSSH